MTLDELLEKLNEIKSHDPVKGRMKVICEDSDGTEHDFDIQERKSYNEIAFLCEY